MKWSALMLSVGLLTSFARADVSDSGNLSIGGDGVIIGTMTVGSLNMSGSTSTIFSASSITASAFFGDGSHLTGLVTGSAVLAATQTFSGINTYTSTSVFSGQAIFKSVVDFSGSYGSTFTTLTAQYNASNWSLGPCITGSSVTLVFVSTHAANIQLNGGSVQSWSDSNSGALNFEADGSFFDGWSASNVIYYPTYSVASRTYWPLNINYTTNKKFPPGSHTFCVTIISDAAGPRGLDCSTGNGLGLTTHCNFRIAESLSN